MLNDDTVTPEVTDPQTTAPETAAEEPSGGTQPASEPATTTPPPDKSAGSEPSIPLSRFNEVIRERNELRLRFQQPQAPQQPNTLPQAPKQEDFQDFDAYNAAVIDFRVQQGIQTYEQRQQQANAQRQYQDRANKAMNNFSQKLVEAVSKDPTVQAIIESAPALRPDLQVNLGEFKDPVGLAKHLAMNPNLVYEMNNLPPDLAVQRMWNIGQTLAGSTTPPQTRVSKAPPPISPVGNGKTSAAQRFSNDMSQEEFDASFKPIW